MKTILEKDIVNNWNTTPPIPTDKIGNVNCHRFMLYVIGKISWDEMVSDPKIQKKLGKDFIYSKAASDISNIPFTSLKDFDALVSYMDQNCKIDVTSVAQIRDIETGEVVHSFMIKKNQHDRFTCFDKPGFKYPFNVYELEEVFEFVNKDGEQPYLHQSWRVIFIDD